MKKYKIIMAPVMGPQGAALLDTVIDALRFEYSGAAYRFYNTQNPKDPPFAVFTNVMGVLEISPVQVAQAQQLAVVGK